MSRQGRVEIVLGSIPMGLAILAFFVYLLEWSNYLFERTLVSIGLSNAAKLPICYGGFAIFLIVLVFALFPTVRQKFNFEKFRKSFRYVNNSPEQSPPPPQKPKEPRRFQLPKLIAVLDDSFDNEELRTLCFELGVEYDNLPGTGKKGKARELIRYLERRERIPDLLTVIKQKRPYLVWRRYL